MLNRIIPALALGIFAITTPACADIDTLTRADRTRAEAQRLTAQASADDALARLTSAQAISITLAVQHAQAERLTSEVIRQSETTRVVALTLVLALFVLIIGGVTVAVLAVRRPTTIYYLTPAARVDMPMLPDPDEWPEVRARRRALAQREAQR